MKPNKEVARLINAALSAQKHAYCPYSRYPVGAAVLTDSGRIFAGCNVENASYGLSLCAERVAIFNAIARNQKSLKAVCVVSKGARPCGACRQVMFEFSTKETALYLVNSGTRDRRVTRTSVFAMLPLAFDPLDSGLLPANPQNLLRVRQSLKKTRGRRRARRARK